MTILRLRRQEGDHQGTVSAIRQVFSKKPQKEAPTSDVVGRSIDIAKAVSSIGAATPVPWISAAADAVVKVLQVFQVSSTAFSRVRYSWRCLLKTDMY